MKEKERERNLSSNVVREFAPQAFGVEDRLQALL
jgi:hypothetical protein